MKTDQLASDGLPLWPAAERNKQPILEVLQALLAEERGVLLEIASGTGQHALHLAAGLPRFDYQPSDIDPEHLATLAARVASGGLSNLRPPLGLDVRVQPWPVPPCRAVYCANMLHIAPPEAGVALLRGAERALELGGLLLTYGPYRMRGEHTASSNADFDASLRQRNPLWGVRDVEQLEIDAAAFGIVLTERVPMPANNFLLVWQRTK